MPHHLCRLPSIPLSFGLAAVLLRRLVYCVNWRTPNCGYSEPTSFTAWTTRVSNPVCSPCFRTSASALNQIHAFAFDIPSNLYEFHLSTRNSSILFQAQASLFQRLVHSQALGFYLSQRKPPTCPLRPIILNNTCPFCLTAAAGTELAGASSLSVVIIHSQRKRFTTKRAFIPHAK